VTVRNLKSAPFGESGHDQMKVGSYCTNKLQTF